MPTRSESGESAAKVQRESMLAAALAERAAQVVALQMELDQANSRIELLERELVGCRQKAAQERAGAKPLEDLTP